MTLLYMYFTTDQVRVSSICVDVCMSYAPFGTKYSFSRYLPHALKYWAEILHFTFILLISDQVRMSSFFVGAMPLLELTILEIHSFPLFSPTWSDILSRIFAYDFLLIYYRSHLSVFTLRQSVRELYLLLNFKYSKYAVSHSFPHFSPTYFDILSWNFAYDFMLLHYRSSSGVVTLRLSDFQSVCPYLLFSTTRIDKLSRVLNLTLFFLNAFL